MACNRKIAHGGGISPISGHHKSPQLHEAKMPRPQLVNQLTHLRHIHRPIHRVAVLTPIPATQVHKRVVAESTRFGIVQVGLALAQAEPAQVPLDPLRRPPGQRPSLPERQDPEIGRGRGGLARDEEGFEGLDRRLRGNRVGGFGGFGSDRVSGEGVGDGGHCSERMGIDQRFGEEGRE